MVLVRFEMVRTEVNETGALLEPLVSLLNLNKIVIFCKDCLSIANCCISRMTII